MVESIVAIVGKGHSGTRGAISWFREAGYDIECGVSLNTSLDRTMDCAYEAARICSRYVRYEGNNRWDFGPLHYCRIDPTWQKHMRKYMKKIVEGPGNPRRAFKLPELTFSLPWLVREYPQIKFVLWFRDPRDAILKFHGTDNLEQWGVTWEGPIDEMLRRAISYRYQAEILHSVSNTPNIAEVWLEELAFQENRDIYLIVEDLLGHEMPRFKVNHEAIGRWKNATFSRAVMREIGPYLY